MPRAVSANTVEVNASAKFTAPKASGPRYRGIISRTPRAMPQVSISEPPSLTAFLRARSASLWCFSVVVSADTEL